MEISRKWSAWDQASHWGEMEKKIGVGTRLARFYSIFQRLEQAKHRRHKKSAPRHPSLRKQPTLRDATTGFSAKWRLRNDAEIPYWWRATTQIGSVWLRQIFQAAWPIRGTFQIWVVTRHWFGISVLFSDIISLGQPRWRREVSALFSGYSPSSLRGNPRFSLETTQDYLASLYQRKVWRHVTMAAKFLDYHGNVT